MPIYFARVELHDANSNDYELLHTAMADISFHRSITCQNKSMKLPTGMYRAFLSNTKISSVQHMIEDAAAKTKRQFWSLLVPAGEGFAIRSEALVLPGYGATTTPTTCFDS